MSSLLSSTWGVVTRHKKKFIASAVVVGGGVCAYYYAKRLLTQGMQQQVLSAALYALSSRLACSGARLACSGVSLSVAAARFWPCAAAASIAGKAKTAGLTPLASRQRFRRVEELGKQFQDTMVEQQLREGELERVRSECTDTVLTFVPPLRKQLNKCTDPRPVTLKLKERRTRSKSSSGGGAAEKPEGESPITELWDELKVISLTRLIASVYGLVLLDLLLRLQARVLLSAAGVPLSGALAA